MKYKWKCRWEIYPIPETEIIFNSFEEVNRFVRDIISKHVDISSYIEELKGYGNYKYFLHRAEFLKRYIEDPNFPYSEADFPFENHSDYDDCDTYFDDAPEFKECFKDFENEGFYISNEKLDLNPAVDFMSDFVLPDPNSFDDFYDGKMRVSFEERLDITVTKQEGWEPSSYPIMVLKVLEDAAGVDEPLLQVEISQKIESRFFKRRLYEYEGKKALHRNIIGRILKMLRDLGLTINRSKEGYLLDKSCMNESPSIKEGSFGSKANSVMILCVLQSADEPLTRGEIVEKIKERFNHKIEIKTVGRNVELLQDFDYKIKKFGNKGYLLQK